MGMYDLNKRREQVAKILVNASPNAARVLVNTLRTDAATASAKIDCAKDILTRAYGKTGIIADDTQGQELCVVMEGDVLEEAN